MPFQWRWVGTKSEALLHSELRQEFGLGGIQTHDHAFSGRLLYSLSYEAKHSISLYDSDSIDVHTQKEKLFLRRWVGCCHAQHFARMHR